MNCILANLEHHLESSILVLDLFDLMTQVHFYAVGSYFLFDHVSQFLGCFNKVVHARDEVRFGIHLYHGNRIV